MLPFLNMRLYNRNNYHALQPWIEKMKNNQLTVENMLEEDEIVQDLKTNPNSQFLYMISNETIRKLIDYATKMPASDDQKVGHKYPFNAAEILSCDNTSVMDRLMNEIKYGDDSEEDEKEEKEEEDKGEKEKEEGEKKDGNEDENEEFVEVKEDEDNKEENKKELIKDSEGETKEGKEGLKEDKKEIKEEKKENEEVQVKEKEEAKIEEPKKE